MTPSPSDFLSGAESVGVVEDPDTGMQIAFFVRPGVVLVLPYSATTWPLIWWRGDDPKRLTKYHQEPRKRETYSAVVPISSVLTYLSGLRRPCTMDQVMEKPSARAAVRMYNTAREMALARTATEEETEIWSSRIDEDSAKHGRWSWDLHLWASQSGKRTPKKRHHIPTLDMFRCDP